MASFSILAGVRVVIPKEERVTNEKTVVDSSQAPIDHLFGSASSLPSKTSFTVPI